MEFDEERPTYQEVGIDVSKYVFTGRMLRRAYDSKELFEMNLELAGAESNVLIGPASAEGIECKLYGDKYSCGIFRKDAKGRFNLAEAYEHLIPRLPSPCRF